MLKLKLLLSSLLLAGVSNATLIVYNANLNGPNEPTSSTGTGFAVVTFDNVLNTLRVQVTFSGLGSGTTASHIHCCTAVPFAGTAGVATTTPTFAGFPLAVTAGTYDNTLDLLASTSYNAAFVTANGGLANAETALIGGLAAGTTYLNIHTSVFPGGEIRGFLVAAPEPGTVLLLSAGLYGLLFARRRRVA